METERVLQVIQNAVDNADKRGIRVEVQLDSRNVFGVLRDRVIISAEKRTGMGTLHSPSRYDCLRKLEANPDMPYFLLLASDEQMPKRVRDWASTLMIDPRSTAQQRDKAAEAYEVAGRAEAWQVTHGKKLAD